MKYYKYKVSRNIEIKKGRFFVRFRVSFSGDRTELYTGVSFDRMEYWDEDKKQIVHGAKLENAKYNVLNQVLSTQETFISNYFDDCSYREEVPNLSTLKSRFNAEFKMGKGQQVKEFFYLYRQYIDEAKEIRAWSPNYLVKVERCYNRLYNYDKEMKFSSFTKKYLIDYKEHLLTTLMNDACKGELKILKEFLDWAYDNEYPVSKEYRQFYKQLKLQKNDNDVRYLEIDEIIRIAELEFEEFSTLDNTRNFLVFMCFTALRYIDMTKLNKRDITYKNGSYQLTKKSQKDKGRLALTLVKYAQDIYLKYRDLNPQDEKLFPITTNQKFNKQLKKIGEIAKIEGEVINYKYKGTKEVEERKQRKDIISHYGRKSFIVNAINSGMSDTLVALWTSHEEVDNMKAYITLSGKGRELMANALREMYDDK